MSHVPVHGKLVLRLSKGSSAPCKIEVHSGSSHGPLLGSAVIPPTGAWDHYADVPLPLNNAKTALDLCFVVRGAQGELVRLDSWHF